MPTRSPRFGDWTCVSRMNRWKEPPMDTKDASHLDSRETLPTGAVSRRAALRGIGGVGIATALGIAAPGRTGAAASTASVPAIEPKAGSWKTWILSAGDQLRPAAPPDEAATKAELA